MDEEFFFPQNVRTTYRLFMLGPAHLRRLLLAPVIGLAVAIGLARFSLFLGVGAGVFLAAIYAGLACIPLMGEEQTLLDVALEIRRHQKSQGIYRHRGEVKGNGPWSAA